PAKMILWRVKESTRQPLQPASDSSSPARGWTRIHGRRSEEKRRTLSAARARRAAAPVTGGSAGLYPSSRISTNNLVTSRAPAASGPLSSRKPGGRDASQGTSENRLTRSARAFLYRSLPVFRNSRAIGKNRSSPP